MKFNQIASGFLIGLVVGLVVGVSPLRHHLRPWDKRAPQERMLDRFSSRLDLTPDQKTKVAAIFEAKRVKIDALMAEGRPKLDQIRMETRDEIRKILNPAQLKKFEMLAAKMDERLKKRAPHFY